MNAEHGCGATVYDGYLSYPCSRNGKHEENGRWWCTQHLPSNVKAKRDVRNQAWADERAAAKRAAAAADVKAARLSDVLGSKVNASAIYHPTRLGVTGYRFVIADPDSVLGEGP